MSLLVWWLKVLGYKEYEPYELYDIVQSFDTEDRKARFILVRVSEADL